MPEVVADDPVLREVIDEAFIDFPRPLEPLAADSLVARLGDALANRSDARPSRGRKPVAERGVRLAREFLIAEARRTVASEELERVAGLDRFALARQFRAAYGTSPHRFQVGRRLVQARRAIMDGVSIADAAAATRASPTRAISRAISRRASA